MSPKTTALTMIMPFSSAGRCEFPFLKVMSKCMEGGCASYSCMRKRLLSCATERRLDRSDRTCPYEIQQMTKYWTIYIILPC
eukprot:6196262-Pleurochrysis_carterae.AAC.1